MRQAFTKIIIKTDRPLLSKAACPLRAYKAY